MGVENHIAKKQLVDQGRAHGILVFGNAEPIGWCQYGSSDELHGPGVPETSEPVWRITFFVVDKNHRRHGVAGISLRAALEAIRNKGGGLVEAYPVACWTHGRNGSAGPVYVQGVGPVAPACGGFGNVSTSGIASMFGREGFEAVSVCGPASARVRSHDADGCHVLMRKRV